MNSHALPSAVVTLLITFSTALIALFNQPGVTEFEHISEVGYASAFLGALVAGANTYRARMATPPEAKK